MALKMEDFSFLTQGKIDKVIFIKEGPIPTGTFAVDIPTGMSEVFLPHLSISLDGVTWYSDESPRYTGTASDVSISGTCYPNNVRIFPNTGGAGGFYRILGVKNDIS